MTLNMHRSAGAQELGKHRDVAPDADGIGSQSASRLQMSASALRCLYRDGTSVRGDDRERHDHGLPYRARRSHVVPVS